MTTEEAAEHLLVSPRTLEGWRHAGKGPAFVRLAGTRSRVLYRKVDLDTWLAKHVVDPATGKGVA